MKNIYNYVLLILSSVQVFGQTNDKLSVILEKEPQKKVIDNISYYNEGVNNLKVDLEAKNILVLEAITSPSSGYSWNIIQHDSSMLSIVDKNYLPNLNIGADTKDRIILKGLKEGTTIFSIAYKKKWEKKYISTYQFEISVEGNYNGNFDYKPEPIKLVNSSLQNARINSNLPSKFDWRDSGIVTSVKDQGPSGACWAFAACGTFEAIIKKNTGKTIDISEQWVGDCNNMGYSVEKGGWYPHQMFVDHGAVLESESPFTFKNGICKSNYDYKEKALNWGYTDGLPNTSQPWFHSASIEQIKTALLKHGPLTVNSYVGDWGNDNSYNSSGVYVADDGKSGHMVVLTGWDDALNCWIIKNSWGEWFNSTRYSDPKDAGYIKMSYFSTSTKLGVISVWLDYDNSNLNNTLPIAGFDANLRVAKSNTEILFTPTEINNTYSYKWIFKGASVENSNSQNPIVKYLNDGVYDVTLIVTNQNGKSDSITKENYIIIESETYCVASGTPGTGSDYITNISFGKINNTSGKNSYSDYTYLFDVYKPAETFTVSMKLGWSFSPDRGYAWVDWNDNQVFETNERYDFSTFINHLSTVNITVPHNVKGYRRMRIRNVYSTSNTNPCLSIDGEVEDYALLISDCNGEINGKSYIDKCNVCVGGSTNLTDCEITSIENSFSESRISISPNPSSGNFNIEYKTDKNETISVKLISTIGQVCISKNYTLTQGLNSISIGNESISKGIYWVVLENEEGEKVSKKIIIY